MPATTQAEPGVIPKEAAKAIWGRGKWEIARLKRIYANCTIWCRHALTKLQDLKPDIVVLGSTCTYGFTRSEWIAGTRKLVTQVRATTDKVYLLRSTPTLPFNGPDCLAPRSTLFQWLVKNPQCSSPAHDKRSDQVYTWPKQAGAPFNNTTVVDMTSAVCPEDTCKAQRNGVVVFRDEQHMTASFARSLAAQAAQRECGFRSRLRTRF